MQAAARAHPPQRITGITGRGWDLQAHRLLAGPPVQLTLRLALRLALARNACFTIFGCLSSGPLTRSEQPMLKWTDNSCISALACLVILPSRQVSTPQSQVV